MDKKPEEEESRKAGGIVRVIDDLPACLLKAEHKPGLDVFETALKLTARVLTAWMSCARFPRSKKGASSLRL